MNCTIRNRKTGLITLNVALLVTAAAAVPLQAGQFTLTDGNASIGIDTLAQATVYEWKVEGINHLKAMSNWYRVDGMTQEEGVHTLALVSETQSGNSLSVVYDDHQGRFTIETVFGVWGGPIGSGLSTMGERILITNNTAAPLNFYLFEYVDLDLYESPGDDTAMFTSPGNVLQTDSLTTFTGSFNADRYELNTYSNTLQKLATDGLVSDLSHPTSGWPVGSGPVGPPDVTFAVQWNFAPLFHLPRGSILPGQTVVIEKESLLEMTIVPEPSSWLLFIVGGLSLLLGQRRARWRLRSLLGVAACEALRCRACCWRRRSSAGGR